MIDPRKFMDSVEGFFIHQYGQDSYRNGVMYTPSQVELLMNCHNHLSKNKSREGVLHTKNMLLSDSTFAERMDPIALEEYLLNLIQK